MPSGARWVKECAVAGVRQFEARGPKAGGVKQATGHGIVFSGARAPQEAIRRSRPDEETPRGPT